LENRERIDLAFNYSMGIRGESGYAHLPAMLEMLGIPYTGSCVLTQALVMNKYQMSYVLRANGIATPPAYLLSPGQKIVMEESLDFPLMVKPVARGSSAGITQKSYITSLEELEKQVRFVWETFGESALVQQFLEGREVSVGMVGNPPQVLPMIEPDFSKLPEGYLPFDSLEVKWIVEEEAEEVHLTCPAQIPDELEREVKEVCLKTWEALHIRDYTRIDLRCDRNGKPHVLDVNSPAGLIPPEVSTTSYLSLAARTAGIEYRELLQRIIDAATARTMTQDETT
jgi:D-alanine-D-alanine ligase